MNLYEPLDTTKSEIRLLTLFPDADFDADIVCLLKVVSLDETTDFEAVSYVWGDVSTRQSISVGGELMLVTVNLVAALRRLRQPQARRVVWVDAICIDQGNISEKNTQIPLMARLYRSAKSVLAWLGEPTDAMEAAILWALGYVDAKDESRSDLDSLHSAASDQNNDKVENLLHSANDRMSQPLSGIAQFKELPYWKRMWTLQEYKLPTVEPICLCGQFSFSASQLLDRADTPLLTAQVNDMTNGWPRAPSTSSREMAVLMAPEPAGQGSMDNAPFKKQKGILNEAEDALDDNTNALKMEQYLLAENKFLRERPYFQLAETMMETLKHGDAELRNLLSAVQAHGSTLGSAIPEFASVIQQAERAMVSVREQAFKAATPMATEGSFISFTSLRKPLGGSPWPLLDLLLDSQHRKCYDVRDKVYALYGMAPEIQKIYPPDYKKCPEQIFQETAVYIFRHEPEGISKMFEAYEIRYVSLSTSHTRRGCQTLPMEPR
ncbi:hypothetical protein TruAng_001935 [Truncatella angustata]|nr:hypothetical protein TruAng_001935 [Truncatella angustata]